MRTRAQQNGQRLRALCEYAALLCCLNHAAVDESMQLQHQHMQGACPVTTMRQPSWRLHSCMLKLPTAPAAAAGWRMQRSMSSSGCCWRRPCSSRQPCTPAAARCVSVRTCAFQHLRLHTHARNACHVCTLPAAACQAPSIYNPLRLTPPPRFVSHPLTDCCAASWPQAVSAAAVRRSDEWAGANEGRPHEGSSRCTAGQGARQSTRSTGVCARLCMMHRVWGQWRVHVCMHAGHSLPAGELRLLAAMLLAHHLTYTLAAACWLLNSAWSFRCADRMCLCACVCLCVMRLCVMCLCVLCVLCVCCACVCCACVCVLHRSVRRRRKRLR